MTDHELSKSTPLENYVTARLTAEASVLTTQRQRLYTRRLVLDSRAEGRSVPPRPKIAGSETVFRQGAAGEATLPKEEEAILTTGLQAETVRTG